MRGPGSGSGRVGPHRGQRPVPLGRGGRRVGAPGHVGQRALAELRFAGEQVAHVVDEERPRLRVALLVARARRQHEQPLRPRGADVEQVALAVEAVLAHREQQSAGGGDRPAVLVGQERLRRRSARELALLQTADEHGLEAPGADRLRRGHLHAVGLRDIAHVDLELLEHPVHPGGVGRARAAPLEEGTQLPEGRLACAEGPGLVELRAGEHGRPALVGHGEQPAEAAFQLGHQRGAVARVAEPVELVERPALLLPQAAGLIGRVGSLLAHVRLESVGQPGQPQQPRACAGRPAGPARRRPAGRSGSAPAGRGRRPCARTAPSDRSSRECRRPRRPARAGTRSGPARGRPRPGHPGALPPAAGRGRGRRPAPPPRARRRRNAARSPCPAPLPPPAPRTAAARDDGERRASRSRSARRPGAAPAPARHEPAAPGGCPPWP